MIVKLTRSNQFTIPKGIIKKLKLKPGKDYLNVEYADGIIYVVPVDLEERISPEAFEKFQEKALKIEKGDFVLSEKEAKNFLNSKIKEK
jgi:AbrB family looped-hinge helix DNA binding protein